MFGLATRARGAGDQGQVKDELEKYSSIHPARIGGYATEKEGKRARDAKGKGVDRESDLVEAIREMTDMEEVASLDKRWNSSWRQPLFSR